MPNKRQVLPALAAATIAGVGYAVRKRSQRSEEPLPSIPAAQASRLLERAAPLLHLPTGDGASTEAGLLDDIRVAPVPPDGSGLRCPRTGRTFPYRDGILDLLGDVDKTITQDALDTPLTAWAYDRFRGSLTRALNSPGFDVEVAHIQQALQAQPGDIILDLACGHGNFTVEWAKRAGPQGLVIGLDLSPAMLARAAYHVRRWGLDNVLLIRGDAHDLPFANGAFAKVNCSGGFHQFPDLPRALAEIARVSGEGAVLTASTLSEGPDDRYAGLKHWLKDRFDLHFVPLRPLGRQLAVVGYQGYDWSLPGGWFGYTSARKKLNHAGAGLPGHVRVAAEPPEGDP
jgi:ubiquinone/menaquinone biosynthesis C-methylase UbiE